MLNVAKCVLLAVLWIAFPWLMAGLWLAGAFEPDTGEGEAGDGGFQGRSRP